MIKAIIVDDEQHCIDRLKNLVATYCNNEVNIIEAFDNIDDAYVGLQQLKPDLVFLDVQINRETGFDLLRKLPTFSFHVIFTTAYEQYAVKAFKFSATDYLLKPIDVDDLKDSLKKIKESENKGIKNEDLNLLIENIKNIQHHTKKITVPTLNGLEFLNVQDILHCKSDVNYTTLYMKDKSKLMVAKTLKEFENILSSYNFFRVHNSHLVNLNYIKSYNKGKGGYLILDDNTEIEVSTRKKDDFLQKLAEINN
ncbi:MAG: LytTR family DNA-binding domain-containing protein [Bacteroidota bacterium]